MPLDEQEQRALVFLAKRARDRLLGARKWDEPGIAAQVAKVASYSLPEVMRAVANAVEDRELVTPGAIGNPAAKCWRTAPDIDRSRGRVDWSDPTAICADCSKPEPECRRVKASGHEFKSVRDLERELAEKRLDAPATVRGLKDLAAHPEES